MEDQTNFLLEATSNQVPETPPIRWYKKTWGKAVIVGAILSFASLTWFAYVVVRVVGRAQTNEFDPRFMNAAEATPPYDISQIVNNDDPVLGERTAPITIVEFGDFLCPQSLKSYTIIRELATKYPKEVKIVWKNLPILDLLSVDLAQAGECAHFQGKFWAFHDRVFSTQAELETIEDIYEVASQVGVDEKVFARCMENESSFMKISEDLAQADLVGAVGTPTFIVNGYKISGSMPADMWDEVLVELLGKKK